MLFFFSLDPGNGVFQGMVGLVPANGEVRPAIVVPNVSALSGLTFFLGGAEIDAATGQVLAVTNTHRVIL